MKNWLHVCFIVFLLSYNLFAQSSGSKIVITIPYDKVQKKYTYVNTLTPSVKGLNVNFDKANEWAKRKLTLISFNKKDNNVAGTGIFHFSNTLDLAIATKQEFTVEFNCRIVLEENSYKYSIKDIMLIQNPSTLKTKISLEEFVHQYQSQPSLNEEVVKHVNEILHTTEQQIESYITDLTQSM